VSARPQKLSPREQILETASRLFYRDGIRAVGVDTIVAESGVAKMTLYRHFPSKDALVVAYLERSQARFREWMEGLIAPHAGNPRRALEAVFEGVVDLTRSPECLGCAFLGTAAEFPQLKHPGHRKAMDHKRAVLARLAELASAAGAHNPAGLAEQLLLLMDGAWGAVRMFGPRSHASRVAEAARALIAAHTAPGGKRS
jgi:AcrR family transcriptional regulator